MLKQTNLAVKNGHVPHAKETQLESKLRSNSEEVSDRIDRPVTESIETVPSDHQLVLGERRRESLASVTDDSDSNQLATKRQQIQDYAPSEARERYADRTLKLEQKNQGLQEVADRTSIVDDRKLVQNPELTSNSNTSDERLQTSDFETQDNNWSLATFELLDALPQVWTRGLLYFLIIFVSIVLPWTMLFKIDETGTARGRLEPEGNTFLLDSPVAGEVTEIKVKQGERVRTGQVLVVLESAIVRKKLEQQKSLLRGQETRLSQLRSLLEQLQLSLSTQQQQNQAQLSEKQARVREARQNLESLKQIYYLQDRQQKAQVRQAFIAVSSSKNERDLVSIQLQGAREKLTRYEKVYSQGIIPKDRYEEVSQSVKENKERLLSAESEIELARSRLKESQINYQKLIQENQSKIQQTSLRYSQEKSGYLALVSSTQLALLKTQEQIKNVEKERTTLLAEIEQNKSEIESLSFQLKQRIIKAPADGTVFDLPMQKAGVVLQPGEKIAEIAPLGSPLILKAEIATHESGSLEQGMAVKIKFDAYPFQDYGIVEGKLIEISPTSKISEKQNENIATYDLTIELDRPCIVKYSECVPLRPGDTANAEIIVRQRRIIDLIIDPFKKLSNGGLEL